MAPAIVHSWGLYNQNHGINQVVADPYMLSFAGRWYGSKTVTFKSVYHNGTEDMLNTLWSMLNEADAIVSWNGAGFDTKHAHREFIKNGLKPTATPHEIDLLRTARSQFKFLSNKLDYVSQYLGVGAKKSTGGHELWVACMNGDEKAWNTMRSYNKQDVNLLVDLYEYMLPWIKNHPNVNLFSGVEEEGCPTCGSQDIQKRGFVRTGITAKQRYWCANPKCGRWFTGSKVIQRAEFR